jgi:hypothetical protein
MEPQHLTHKDRKAVSPVPPPGARLLSGFVRRGRPVYRPAPGVAVPRLEQVPAPGGFLVIPNDLHRYRRTPEAVLRARRLLAGSARCPKEPRAHARPPGPPATARSHRGRAARCGWAFGGGRKGMARAVVDQRRSTQGDHGGGAVRNAPGRHALDPKANCARPQALGSARRLALVGGCRWRRGRRGRDAFSVVDARAGRRDLPNMVAARPRR